MTKMLDTIHVLIWKLGIIENIYIYIYMGGGWRCIELPSLSPIFLHALISGFFCSIIDGTSVHETSTGK